MLVKHIMTQHLKTLTPNATLHDAHNMSRQQGIRHIPIVDPSTHKFIGVVTQKALVAKVMSLVSHVPPSQLADAEKAIAISDVYVVDCKTITPEQSVLQVAEYFLSYKHGCLPVVDEQKKLVGIVTSSDFVKLAITLLQQQKA